MENPDVTEDDDSVELSFQELLQSSPYICWAVGALSACLTFAVLMSLFIPAECTGNQRVHASKRKIFIERGSQTGCSITASLISDARYQHLLSTSSRRPLYQGGKDELEYAQIRHREIQFSGDLRELGRSGPCASQLEYPKWPRNQPTYGSDTARSLASELHPDYVASNVAILSRTRSCHQVVWDTASKKCSLSEKKLKKLNDVAPHSELNYPPFAMLVDGCKTVKTNRKSITQSKPANYCSRQRKSAGLNSSTLAMSGNRVGSKGMGTTRTWFDRTDEQLEEVVNAGDESEEYCSPELSPLKHKPYRISEVGNTNEVHSDIHSSLPKPSLQHQPAPGVSSKRGDRGLTVEPATGVSSRLSRKNMPRRGPPPCCPTQSGGSRPSDRMPQVKDEPLEKVVNDGDECEEYCSPELSPLKHKPYRISEVGNTNKVHSDIHSSLPKPCRQHQPAPGVSSKRGDRGLTVEPATGVSSRLSRKNMPRRGPPPCCPTQSGGSRPSDRMPQVKGKMLQTPVNSKKQRRRKNVTHNDSHLPRALPAPTKSLRQQAASFSHNDSHLPRALPAPTKSLRQWATSRSHNGRPLVTPSNKFALHSVPDNAQLFHFNNYNHILNSENAADDSDGRKCLQSGLYNISSCSLHNTLSTGNTVFNLAKNNGLPYNGSFDGKLKAALMAMSDECENCYSPILAHGSNVYRPVGSVLSIKNVRARMAVSEVASNGHSQPSHLDVATMDQRMVSPCCVIERSMFKSPVPVARHGVQGDMLSLNGALTTTAMTNISQTLPLSDQGQHAHGSSEYHKTRMSKRQRKQNYIDGNGSVITADCLWKSDVPGRSQQFGNSANALLCTSTREFHDNATAKPWRKTHGAGDKQRITFRQCSAARESHQNVPTFTLRAVSSEQEHATVSAITDEGQSNRESYNERQFITNPSLLKHIDSKTFVSLGSCSSELKSLMRTTIIDLQKYKPEGSTVINDLPPPLEELSLENQLGSKQLVSRRRAHSRRQEDQPHSRHPTDSSACRGHSLTCNINRREHAPRECRQQIHGTLTGADATTSHALSWGQRRKISDHTASGHLSSSRYQSHQESGQMECATDTVFSRESTSKVTLRDPINQFYFPCDCRSYIDCNDLDNGRCDNHCLVGSGDKFEFTDKKSRRKRPLRYRCPNSNIICQETFREVETEPPKLVPTACMIPAHSGEKMLNCDTHTSVQCIKTHGAELSPDKQKLNKRFALEKNKSRHKAIKSRITTVGGDDRIDQHIFCGAMPDKSWQSSNVAQTSKQSEDRCGDGEQKVAHRCGELHSQTNSSQECTQQPSVIDSLSVTRESEIVQESPNGKLDFSIHGIDSRKTDEHAVLFSTDTSTLYCDEIASAESFSVSVSWDECPSTDLQKVVNSQTRSQTSSQTCSQTHKYPHHPSNLEHRIRDRNVSHGSSAKYYCEDISHLVPSAKVRQDNRCSKVRCQITKEQTPDKRNHNIRHTSTDHYPLIGEEIIQAKKKYQNDLTWWQLPNRDRTHDYSPKDRHQRHKFGINLTSKKCALRETGLQKQSQMILRNSLPLTSRESCRFSNSHILVLRRGPNNGVQNSISSQSTSSGTSLYVAQIITDTSSLDLSDNPYRLQDALIINTDSFCRQSYQSSSSTSIATIGPSITISTDTSCCPIMYACGGDTYMSGEKMLDKMRCRSLEQLDDMSVSSLNNALKMNSLECQSVQTINSWSKTITTKSNESYLTGWDGSQLPMYCEFTGASSVLAGTKTIPKKAHPREEKLFAYTSLKPKCGHYGVAMSIAHRHEERCESVRSSERYTTYDSCGTLPSSCSSNIEHSCGTVQPSDNSIIEDSCTTVQLSDDSDIQHSCGTVQLPYICSPDHSCWTEQTGDNYNTDRSCETLQLPDCRSNQHGDPALKASQRQLKHRRKPVSRSMSPPSIRLNGEHVSYMQIVSKNGAFKGFRLSSLNERPFPSILKKSHSKDAKRKRVTGDSLLTVDRPAMSLPVSQIVGFDVSLESESNASEASLDCSSISSHAGRARPQLVEVDDNSKHVVCANPIDQMELTYQESAQETRDDLHKSKACINRQVCKHSHGKSVALRARGDSHSGVISKSTHRTDFVETPKYRKEVNEKKLPDQNPASIQTVNNMYTSDQAVKNTTETRQAHKSCKNSKIPRIFSQNTNISKRQQGKGQEREKTNKENSRKPFIGILMNRQEATSISKKYQTTARKESNNTVCKKVERSKCNNESDQVAGVLTRDLNSKHYRPSSLRLHRRPKCSSTCQQTTEHEIRSHKDSHKQPPNNVGKPRGQKFLQNTKYKPEANNTDSYKVETVQVRKNRVSWHRQNIANELKLSRSKYQGPSKLVDIEGVQPVSGSKASQILTKQASSKAHVQKCTHSAAKRAKAKTVLSPRNLKTLEEKTNNDYKKRIISQHESAKMKEPLSHTSKNCKLKATFPSKKSEHGNKTRTAHTFPHPCVDNSLRAVKKTSDVSLAPCKSLRKDLFQRQSITHLTTGKKSEPSKRQRTSNQKNDQSQLGLVSPRPRRQKTMLSRNISQSVCQPGISKVSPTEWSPPKLSHGLLNSKLRDNKRKVGSETHCMKQSSPNSVMKYNDPRCLTKIKRHGSTCSPEEKLSHALSGSSKVRPNYVNKQSKTGPGTPNPKVSSSDGRHHISHQRPDVDLSHQTRWTCRPVRNHKIPKTVLAAGDIENLASLSNFTSAAPFVGLRKGPDCYSPTALNTTSKCNRFPGMKQNSVYNNDRGVQTGQSCLQRNTYDNPQYLRNRRNRSCSQIVRKQKKTLVTQDCSRGQAYKNTTTNHVQFGKSKCDADSSADMLGTRHYGVGRLKHEAEIDDHSKSGVDSFQNIEILQPDTDVKCGYNLLELRGGSSSTRHFQETANFGLNRDLVDEVPAVSGSNSVPEADEHKESQQIQSGHGFTEDGQYPPNDNRYGPERGSTTACRQQNTKLVTAVSPEMIKTPKRYSCDITTSPNDQGCTVDQFQLVKAACGTPRTDSSQQCVSASVSEQPPLIQNALKEFAVNHSTKNVRVHCMAKHLNATNDYTAEDSSMFPNTTDDVSASAVFDNNSSVTDDDYKHWTDVQKNNIRNPCQQYTKNEIHQYSPNQ